MASFGLCISLGGDNLNIIRLGGEPIQLCILIWILLGGDMYIPLGGDMFFLLYITQKI